MAISAGMALLSTATAAVSGTLISAVWMGSLAGTMLGHFLVTTAIGAAINALTPKPSSATANQGYNVTQTGSALDHQVVYGRAKVGGVRIFDQTTGNNNLYLHRVLSFTGHEIESFDELWINDALVTSVGSDGDILEVMLPDNTTSTRYSGYVRIKEHLGSPDQVADTDLVSEVSAWTSNHRLQGLSYLYVRFKFNADVFPNGVPEITATIKGKKVYDTRTGLTGWSDNPALCIRDYLLSNYGLREDLSNIDDTLVSTAADVCDLTDTPLATTRYTCNGAFTTGSTPYDVLQTMLSSMGGLLWYAQGKWRMKPAYWTAPVLTLDENDLRGSITVNTRHSRRDNYNIVNGTFRGEESGWQITDFPPVTNSAFLDADKGQESSIDLQLAFTDTSEEARRLARINLERNRQQLTIQTSFGLRAFQVQVGDNVYINNNRFGWSNKAFEVISWTFGLTDSYDLQVHMTLREVTASVFDDIDDGITYERDNTTLPSPFFVPTTGISNPFAFAQVSNQKITNIVTFTVTCLSPEFVDFVQVEYKKSLDTIWKVGSTGDLGLHSIIDLEANTEYDFRTRGINTFGIKGDWEYLPNFEVKPFDGPPADVTGFVYEVSGGSLFLSWEPVPDLDLSHYEIKHNSNTTGAEWGNSTTIIKKVARPSTQASVPARSGTFLIRAVDKENNYSDIASTLVILPSDLPALGTSLSQTEDPTFSGAKDNITVVSNTIEIDNTSAATPIGTYYFSNYIDVGTARNCRVTGFKTFTRAFDGSQMYWDNIPGNMDSWPDTFDSWTTETANFGDVAVQVYVSATSDDPAGAPTWGDYQLANGSYITGRGFRFKVILESTHATFTPNITNLSATVEY